MTRSKTNRRNLLKTKMEIFKKLDGMSEVELNMIRDKVVSGETVIADNEIAK